MSSSSFSRQLKGERDFHEGGKDRLTTDLNRREESE